MTPAHWVAIGFGVYLAGLYPVALWIRSAKAKGRMAYFDTPEKALAGLVLYPVLAFCAVVVAIYIVLETCVVWVARKVVNFGSWMSGTDNQEDDND